MEIESKRKKEENHLNGNEDNSKKQKVENVPVYLVRFANFFWQVLHFFFFLIKDYNASTPVDRSTADKMLPYLYEIHGNPSSGHYYGKKLSEALKKATNQLANLINCQPEEIIWTSGLYSSTNFSFC